MVSVINPPWTPFSQPPIPPSIWHGIGLHQWTTYLFPQPHDAAPQLRGNYSSLLYQRAPCVLTSPIPDHTPIGAPRHLSARALSRYDPLCPTNWKHLRTLLSFHGEPHTRLGPTLTRVIISLGVRFFKPNQWVSKARTPTYAQRGGWTTNNLPNGPY